MRCRDSDYAAFEDRYVELALADNTALRGILLMKRAVNKCTM